MPSANIKIKPIAGGFAGLGKRAPAATVRVLNRVAASGRAVAAKAISDDLGIKQSAVRAAVAVSKANFATMQADIIARGKRIPLAELAARQTRAGVTYKLGAGRRLRAGAFLARMDSGHEGVFRRIGARRPARKGRYRGQSRQKIIELFGPSPVLVFQKDKSQAPLRAAIRSRMSIEMKAAARFYGQLASIGE